MLEIFRDIMSRTTLVKESRLERIIKIMRCTSSGTRVLEVRVSGDIVTATTCARFSDGFPEEHDTLFLLLNGHFGPKLKSVETHVGRSDFLFTCSLFLFFSHSVSRYGKTVKSFRTCGTSHGVLNPTSNLYMTTRTTTSYNTGQL